MAEVKVFIADGSRMFSEAVAMALWWTPDFEVVGEYPTTGPDAVDAVVRHRPDVALIDYWIPEMIGPSVAATIQNRVPETRVVLLSLFEEPAQRDHATAAGAVGFFTKGLTIDRMIKVIRDAATASAAKKLPKQSRLAAGKLAKKADRAADLRRRFAALTPREMDVLRLLARGNSVQEIARRLQLSDATVRVHAKNISRKAKASTKEQAAAMARFCGLVS